MRFRRRRLLRVSNDVLDSELPGALDGGVAAGVLWYSETVTCLGGTGASFDGIDWYLVPGDGWDSPNLHRPIVGAYYPGDEIFIAEGFRFHRSVVSHEMLHYLHSRKHPAPPFGVCDHS